MNHDMEVGDCPGQPSCQAALLAAWMLYCHPVSHIRTLHRWCTKTEKVPAPIIRGPRLMWSLDPERDREALEGSDLVSELARL